VSAQTTVSNRTASGDGRVRFPRLSADGRVILGVASGIADSLGVDPALIRLAFGLLFFAGGAGAFLYFVLALAMTSPESAPDTRRATRTGLRPVLGITAITWGLLVIFREARLWWGDGLVVPIAIAVLGASVLWGRTEPGSDERDNRISSNPVVAVFAGRISPLKIVVGALLIVVGVGAFVTAKLDLAPSRLGDVRDAMLPMAATLAGFALIFGPWVARLATQLSDERRERIRSEERSALAAHLHDSVLQTLALMQRTGDATRMASLARAQERELRAWLYGKTGVAEGETLAGVLDALAGRCEAMHEVKVDVVTVGDAPLDEQLSALAAACGEALNNAARHSGAGHISVYSEVEPNQVTVYVRDQGVGFDASAVPSDRRGISDSIEGRLRRHGGSASVRSTRGEGTEVMLVQPRTTS
jgi:signal transduction histidine kinase/phage shock protein PspC (stress-responsive transcriptional regulator)